MKYPGPKAIAVRVKASPDSKEGKDYTNSKLNIDSKATPDRPKSENKPKRNESKSSWPEDQIEMIIPKEFKPIKMPGSHFSFNHRD